ncbi:Cloroperoxidase [Saccharata proteae CBS 121410]|uniref:Cloroperoxidase n=1 Tax=Saccharata proteae CBS 121410 TaxID=1314787 RepID=A0A9P4LWI6_9PEZI|nr:Cloroperoxidase [Saccharata proteae CBS 121410]
MSPRIFVSALVGAYAVSAFPFVPAVAGVDSALLHRQDSGTGQEGGPDTCPFNPNHVPAVPYTAAYPYNGAANGQPGNAKGGYLVPAPGDTDHDTDIRGPCPGLNTAANHGFLARDGIVTFNELVDAQQNVYNVGYDLAVLLAVLGLTTTDGDIVTEKLSIGCDATTRTSVSPLLTGSEPGLDGHNHFEADSSLTRNDFFTHNGDNFKFNGTLFGMMDESCNHLFNRKTLGAFRKQRYDQSVAENPNFYFGPLSLLLFGAASFLYELMPGGANNYTPDLPTIQSFFGASPDGSGGWTFNHAEQIPANWTNRIEPYTANLAGEEIFLMYNEAPVPFGGNVGNGAFVPVDFASIKKGELTAASPTDVTCLLYQIATERVPTSLDAVLNPSIEVLTFALEKLNPHFANLGCPLKLT